MAPVDQYLMTDRNAEIAMARSAAPPSISADAEVMVLGRMATKLSSRARMFRLPRRAIMDVSV